VLREGVRLQTRSGLVTRFIGSAVLALSKYATVLLIACGSEHSEDLGVEGRQYCNVP
jgi:hypothetical protein